jgi:hypothetical protein
MTPIGADHMSSSHDGMITPAIPALVADRLKPLGISERLELDDLGPQKVSLLLQDPTLFSA